MAQNTVIISLLLATSTVLVSAQDLSQTIVGCVDVGCPASTTVPGDDNCTVTERSYTSIGLARIPTDNDALNGVSWVKAFNATAPKDNRAIYHHAYYLGTPPDLDLTGTGACAVFFRGVEQQLNFNTSATSEDETEQGTCQVAMGSACVDSLIKRAKTLDVDGLSSADACASLQKDLENNFDDACTASVQGTRWSDLAAVGLAGSGSPEPITEQQNASSNCWPITPRQDDLALVSEFQVEGDILAETVAKNAFSITPVLTLFFPGNGSLIAETDASLTCMKIVGPSNASVGNMNPTDPDSAASPLTGFNRMVTAALFVAAVAAFVGL